jgi:hypothetical protein
LWRLRFDAQAVHVEFAVKNSAGDTNRIMQTLLERRMGIQFLSSGFETFAVL